MNVCIVWRLLLLASLAVLHVVLVLFDLDGQLEDVVACLDLSQGVIQDFRRLESFLCWC